jgi:hypothetical protein
MLRRQAIRSAATPNRAVSRRNPVVQGLPSPLLVLTNAAVCSTVVGGVGAVAGGMVLATGREVVVEEVVGATTATGGALATGLATIGAV